LIARTASLQLIIELYAAGLEGPTNAETKSADQLHVLKIRESAWDELKWSKEERVQMLGGHLWELYGGVFAQSDVPNTITFRRLPSKYRSIDEAEWTIGNFGHPIRDFGMDPAQDLLVLVESPRWSVPPALQRHFLHILTSRSGQNPDHSYHLHLRTMSTGGPHPKAPNPPIISYPQLVQDTQVSYSLQISAQHLGIIFHSVEGEENILAIWEWTSGVLEAVSIQSVARWT
jgi:hypothetical protein